MSQRYIGGLIYNPPGGYSGSFPGSTSYLVPSSTSPMDFGSGAFTIECWVQTSVFSVSGGASRTIIGNSGNSYTMQLYIETTAGKIVFGNTGSTNLQGTSTVADGNWHHVAVSRSGTGSNQTALFIDGVRQAVGTNSQNYTSGTIYIGAFGTSDGFWNGFISNLRIVKGTALYDVTQTSVLVPSGRLQAVTNTSLLTLAYPTFVDGSSNGYTFTTTGAVTVSTQNPFPITTLPNPALGNQGNGVYSMSQYVALKAQGLWPAYDPYFDQTTLLLHGDGTNGAQNNTFLDSSTNNFTITRNGNTTQGTFSPFSQDDGKWGAYFDSTSSRITTPSSSAFNLGTSNFCYEGWVYTTNAGAVNYPRAFGLGPYYNDVNSFGVLLADNDNSDYITVYFNDGTIGRKLISSTTLPNNQWNHLVVCRSGNNYGLFLNGTRIATYSSSSAIGSGNRYAFIGSTELGSEGFVGSVSNVRIVVGSSVYDPTQTTLTVPTTPLTAITNTSLLTCQSNRFKDNSANNFAITVNGNTSIQPFSPFAPSAAYSAATNGGSGYFDGSGDYLTVPDNAAWDLGSSNFTIESWIYPTASPNQPIIIGQWSNPYAWVLLLSNDGNRYLRAILYDGSFNDYVSSTSLQLNSWNHCAFVRDSNTLSLYLNGARVYTTTFSGSVSTSSTAVSIGADATGGSPFQGYLSSTRVIVGTALYSGTTYTVPTAPPTAIANTQLLTNFTNAGILDNTGRNDLETVGNAQISTSVKKFGTGSLAFDGTGDYLLVPTSPNLTFGTGDFTIEAWVNRSTSGSVIHFIDFRGSNNNGSNPVFYWQTNNFIYYTNDNTVGDNQIQTSNAITSSSGWVYLAIVRSGTTLTVYVNGIDSGSVTYSTNVLGGNPVTIANRFSNSGAYAGYIDDLRITKGVARYTSNFTPQTSQWQDQ